MTTTAITSNDVGPERSNSVVTSRARRASMLSLGPLPGRPSELELRLGPFPSIATPEVELYQQPIYPEDVALASKAAPVGTRPLEEEEAKIGTDDEDEMDKKEVAYPEGGVGWVVVAASFVITAVQLGFSYSWGVIQSRLEQRGLAPPLTLAFLSGVASCLPSFLAIPASKVVDLCGPRIAGLIGVALISSAQIASSFSLYSVPGLFITQGLMRGAGSALCYMCTSPLPSQFFYRRRGLATGIVSSGAGVGGAVFAIATQRLIERLGLEWTFRVLACLCAGLCIPAAFLLRTGVTQPPIPSAKARFQLFEWSLFQNRRFILFLVTALLVSFAFFIPPNFVPLYAYSIGMGATKGALMSAGYNLASAFGRIGFGVVADQFSGPLTAVGLALGLAGLSALAIWPVARTVAPLALFAMLNGMGCGGYFALLAPVCGTLLGSQHVSTGLGAIEFVSSAGYLMGSPTVGFLLSAFGGAVAGLSAFRPAIFYVGGSTLGACTIAFVIRFLTNSKLFVHV